MKFCRFRKNLQKRIAIWSKPQDIQISSVFCVSSRQLRQIPDVWAHNCNSTTPHFYRTTSSLSTTSPQMSIPVWPNSGVKTVELHQTSHKRWLCEEVPPADDQNCQYLMQRMQIQAQRKSNPPGHVHAPQMVIWGRLGELGLPWNGVLVGRWDPSDSIW